MSHGGIELIPEDDAPPGHRTASVTEVGTLLRRQGITGYREFLAVPTLSLGMFVAPVGHIDEQEPHDRDEVYVILAGEAVLSIDGVPHAVSAGSVAYVPAGVRHRFAEIRADLRVLIFFAGGPR